MPDTTTFAQAPIPTGPEGAWVPGSMMAYAESIDPKLTHAVSNQAERDANFSTLPAGHLVSCPSANRLWMSLGGGTWMTLGYDSGWVTTGFLFEAGWTGLARVRNHNGVITLSLFLTYGGANFTTSASGGVGDIAVCTIPATFATPYTLSAMANMNGSYVLCSIHTSGLVTLLSGAPSSTFSSGNTLSLSATWQEA